MEFVFGFGSGASSFEPWVMPEFQNLTEIGSGANCFEDEMEYGSGASCSEDEMEYGSGASCSEDESISTGFSEYKSIRTEYR
ncbi:hypothetical protein F8M41_000044 [Gigaspora margarita]|uniref:Uncharacterized protein n=1 Tax=Gigaspora margarita TaxID=4874 RepID=A0A8H4B5P5_GIGMA|nr:hypothetical protein F8M41_000044 [Gigaspora margarita]